MFRNLALLRVKKCRSFRCGNLHLTTISCSNIYYTVQHCVTVSDVKALCSCCCIIGGYQKYLWIMLVITRIILFFCGGLTCGETTFNTTNINVAWMDEFEQDTLDQVINTSVRGTRLFWLKHI